MNYNVLAYILYLIIILFVVLYVGAALYKNGEPFVIKCFQGDHNIGTAVNRFLLAGYYLVNTGYSIMVLKGWEKVTSGQQLIETLSTQAGAIILILGIMHYINIISLLLAEKARSKKIKTHTNH